jgi:pyroglutamyl-peptidase
MSGRRPLILLTGFGPFPGVPDNASARLVHELARAASELFPNLGFEAHVLPVDWQAAPRQMEELIKDRAPAVALHFGVSARATGFVIETQALNATNGALDDCGAVPIAAELIPGARPARRTRLPVRRIVRRLEAAGVPAGVSDDAGRYLCNAVMYRSLALSRTKGHSFRSGFIHIPVRLSGYDREAGHLNWEMAMHGGLVIIEACAAPLIRHG